MKWLDEYRRSLKMVEVEEVFDLYFYRPLAFLFVKTIYRSRLSPNQITLLSMIVGIVGAACIAVADSSLLPVAALLLIIYDVLDCSDGQLARLKNSGSRIGRILDGAADYIVNIAVYLAIAVAIAPRREYPLLWWLLTALAGFSNAGHSILVDYYRNRFLDIVQQRKSTFEEELNEFRKEYKHLHEHNIRVFDRIVIYIYLTYSDFQRRLSSGQKGELSFLSGVDPSLYYKSNRWMLKLWLLLGPTSQLTYIILGLLLSGIETYVLLLLTVGNFFALICYLIQAVINRKLKQLS